ncbi:MAG: TonB-dependent receptor [Gammaproteobacteria bacterium]|jgi:outer membrane receptor protein involved in Fe transport|nr:TonB-dependent receptor [Gammaproteobacteria bacterium]MBP6052937.1 TonB-dependent receptor [Pseudomonadales bacterium]MBK7170379.1 TonB-dependent receptor [Gammaproteobacteria bacterium]MBK7521790.1 TonB-dependent receptor [Gammaproteobacteria bacterium]MBK7728308.1 TonB-dependent receptor [Gammaproteobacteria bacterium]
MRICVAGVGRAFRLRRAVIGMAASLPLLGIAVAVPLAQAQTAPAAGASLGIEEVVVTATRRSELLSDVPISVTSFGDEELQQRGVKQFDDLVRLTPGLNLSRQSFTGASQIAIRGISSNAGSGTTGLYIDDTPIQVRNLGFASGNAFPGLFDIERVEVLRGPQGTLFGAGSEGGTVRFIQTQPSLTETSATARGEVSTTENGDESYEAGVAYGQPLSDRVGVRGSAYYRRDGGFIDGVGGTYQIVDPTGASYGDSVDFTKTRTYEEDVNWAETQAFRLAFKFQATEDLSITPSVFYQKVHNNDGAGAGSVYDLATSDENDRDYSRQYYKTGAPGTVYTFPNTSETVTLNAMSAPDNQRGEDEFTLTALALDWDLGWAQLVSNTSYFDRDQYQWSDYTKGYVQYYAPEYFLEADGVTSTGTYAPEGWRSMSQYNNEQQNFVQEIRLQSSDDDARLRWVAGLFYSDLEQNASQPINQNFLIGASWVGFYPTGFDYGYYGVNDGDPFGPGSTGLQNFFGDDALPNGVLFYGEWSTQEKQKAGFVQIDFDLTDTITLTAGIRASENELDFDAAYLGPENNANAPFGFPCFDPADCSFGSGAMAPSYPTSASGSNETAYTPKWGISWEPDDDNMVYATAAKGFRPAGASLRVPSVCDADLITNGYVDANGDPVQPETYDSDSVWSYELGAKSRLMGGRLVLDGSVYRIEWKDIQANVSLPNCEYNFVDNLADATSEGFDLSFQFLVTDNFVLSGAYGYNDPRFDKDAVSPGGVKIYSEDAAIPDAGPPQTLSLTGEYTLSLPGGYDGYARADYTYSAQMRRVGDQVASDPFYDPRLKPTGSFALVNLRLGARFSNYDISLFVLNLTDETADLDLAAGSYYDPQDWSNQALRPRSFGLMGAWRM